jgi:hypothetical protein
MASSPHEASVEDEINAISMGRPHVILLGAGASRAAFINGDRSGKKLPLMADFINHVPIRDLLKAGGLEGEITNFEVAYSAIVTDPKKAEVRAQLERAIFEYFDSLKMPDRPTLYDHLILSLRPKDVIATFNWDPFLIQAVLRNRLLNGKVPSILFLHGNVLSGFCQTDGVTGVRDATCSRCKTPFMSVPLLYPIANKYYEQHQPIAKAWDYLRKSLKDAFMFTVFGYGAPDSDSSAMNLLRGAWGNAIDRSLEQTEIIDTREKEFLEKTWEPFIHTHHYEIHTNFYESWISKHPRRSGEAHWHQYMDAKFISDNPIPRNAGFEELWEWYKPLLKVEAEHQN